MVELSTFKQSPILKGDAHVLKIPTLFATLALIFILEGNPPLPLSGAPPDRKDEKTKKPPVIPQIAGDSVWGEVSQESHKITIHKHPHWYVSDGEIRKDGKLFVYWIQRSDGRVAPGLYDINEDGSITGLWAWTEDVFTDDDGAMHGMDKRDTLRAKLMPPVEQ